MHLYITYRESDAEGNQQYFILQKEFPHFVAKISEQPIVNFIQPMPITNYNLYLVFNGCLRGNIIPSYKDIGEEVKSVMNSMAIWFFEQRVLPNEKKYKKWKIK